MERYPLKAVSFNGRMVRPGRGTQPLPRNVVKLWGCLTALAATCTRASRIVGESWKKSPFAALAVTAAAAAGSLGISVGAAVSDASPTSRAAGTAPRGIIAYKCGDGLCLTRPDGTGKRTLLRTGPWPQWDPAFRPDGRRLAFRGYYGQGDGEYALYLVGSNGCGVRRLTRSIAGDPSWSPNGGWIAFDTSGTGEIWKIHPNGTGLTRIAAGGGASFPTWSPEGTRIAFVRNQPGQGQVWVMGDDGTGATRVHVDVGVGDQAPAWSSDGRRIAFTVSSYPHSWIEVMSADGKGVRALTKLTGEAGNPVWLPRGAGIAFLAAANGYPGLYVMRPNGTHRRAVGHLRTMQFAWVNVRLPRKRC